MDFPNDKSYKINKIAITTIFVISLVVVLSGFPGTGGTEPKSSVSAEPKSSVSAEPKRVTKAEADEFMRNRMYQINQTLMKTKEADYNGTTLYLYMSVAENGMTCISTVSELALEVLAADCGETYRKIDEWNAIR